MSSYKELCLGCLALQVCPSLPPLAQSLSQRPRSFCTATGIIRWTKVSEALGTRLPLVASFCICCVIYTFFSGFELIFLCFTQFGGSCLCLNLYNFRGTAPLSTYLYQVTENRDVFFVRFYICFSCLVLTILDNLDLSGRSPSRSSHQSPRAINLQHQFSSNQGVQQQETRWL